MLFYDKIFEKSGIDCWRLFECSWIDTKGRPQQGLFEIYLENNSEAINTFELKNILRNLAHQEFSKEEEVLLFFQQLLKPLAPNCHVRMINPQFPPVHPISHLPGTYYKTNAVRFICALSKQPFNGELHITFAQPLNDYRLINQFVLETRSKEFMQADFIDNLKSKLQSLRQSYVLSLHIARRGGISYQAIRWFEYPFLEPKSLLSLSPLE